MVKLDCFLFFLFSFLYWMDQVNSVPTEFEAWYWFWTSSIEVRNENMFVRVGKIKLLMSNNKLVPCLKSELYCLIFFNFFEKYTAQLFTRRTWNISSTFSLIRWLHESVRIGSWSELFSWSLKLSVCWLWIKGWRLLPVGDSQSRSLSNSSGGAFSALTTKATKKAIAFKSKSSDRKYLNCNNKHLIDVIYKINICSNTPYFRELNSFWPSNKLRIILKTK